MDEGIPGFKTIISINVFFNESLMTCLSDKSAGSASFIDKENLGSSTNLLIRKYNGEDTNSKKSPKRRVVHIKVQPSKKPNEELDIPHLENVTNDEARSLMQQEDKVTPIPVDGTNIHNNLLTWDRERRHVKPPQKYGHVDCIVYAFLCYQELVANKPKTYKETMDNKHANEQHTAMVNEMNSLQQNQNWKIIPKLKD